MADTTQNTAQNTDDPLALATFRLVRMLSGPPAG